MHPVVSLSSPSVTDAQPARSQVRALMRDLSGMFLQQMFFWGCDVQHPKGNLLLRIGADRFERERSCGEGSSRYRFDWNNGKVELHSFCAGWYPQEATASGVIFIRARERFFDCAGATPLTPGQYEEGRFRFANPDEMLLICRPMLSWLAYYEKCVAAVTGSTYRDQCFSLYRRYGKSRPWLPPKDAQAWLARFLDSPETICRAKVLLREQKRVSKQLKQEVLSRRGKISTP